jgi:hypothetical protein
MSWISKLFTPEEPQVSCSLTGLHSYVARYDTKPTLVITNADLRAFQGSQTVKERFIANEYTTVPRLDLHQITALVEASEEEIYVGESCIQCGDFIRRDRLARSQYD